MPLMKAAVVALLLAACVAQAAGEVFFQEKFDGEDLARAPQGAGGWEKFAPSPTAISLFFSPESQGAGGFLSSSSQQLPH
jgi:hypothetical protein